MDLTKFYQDKDRLFYNPSKSVVLDRCGIKSLVAFDDRFSEVAKNLSSLVGLIRTHLVRILDIGVGDGVYESLLGEQVRKRCEFYGVDISEEQLKRAKKYLKISKKVDLDKESLPFENSYFDIVIISEVLEHLFSPEKALSEAVRTIKKGGYLVITYPNSGALQLRLSLFFSGHSPLLNYSQNKEHIRFFNEIDILKMLPKDLKVVTRLGVGSFVFDKWNFPLKIIFPRILEVIGNKFLPDLALGSLLVLRK